MMMDGWDRAERIGRRAFLRGIAAAPLAAGLAEAAAPRSRVAVAERAKVLAGGRIDRRVAKEAVDALVKRLSGKSNVDEAWRTFVSTRETVALKFNALFRRATTSPEVIWAVLRGLADAGVPQERLIVYDWKRKDYDTAGLRPFEDLPKVRFLTSDSAWDEEVAAGPVKTRLTRVLTRTADALINVSRLKHHVIAGVTIAMKNHFGTIPNPNEFHKRIAAIADLNALEPIRKKTRLAICDAIVGIFDRGPQFHGSRFTWEAKSLLAATDFVALDAVGADMIRKARLERGCGEILPPATHLARAAELGLGTTDLARIDVVRA